MTTDMNNSRVTAPMWWDGGDRAITAREKATIEEHGPSCYAIPLLPAQAVDPADPWRGLYLPARMPAPSEYGDLTHPDIPLWPDDREDALDKLVNAQGFDFHIVSGDFTEAAIEDGDELYWEELRAWNPEAPEGEWRLAWKGDTEDGPYAWFVRPMALRPEPAALAATGKQQVGEVQGDGRVTAEMVEAAENSRVAYLNAAAQYGSMGMDERHSRAMRAALETAFAARQPGAQVRDRVPQEVVSAISAVAVIASKESRHPVQKHIDTISAWLYATPPAQSIDLGRALDIMWNWQEQLGGHVFDARDVVRTLTSSDMQAIGVDARACIDATDRNQAIVLAKREIVRALSSGQRDAAPGVHRG